MRANLARADGMIALTFGTLFVAATMLHAAFRYAKQYLAA